MAIDECHEMKINKDAKMAVVRPTATKMKYLSHYLPFQAACVNNFPEQLFSERVNTTNHFSHRPTSQDRKTAVNVNCMLEVVAKHGLFHSEDKSVGLCNPFKNVRETGEQSHGMLNFRQISQACYEVYIKSKLLNVPSTTAPVR